jgi:hypothetical protein
MIFMGPGSGPPPGRPEIPDYESPIPECPAPFVSPGETRFPPASAESSLFGGIQIRVEVPETAISGEYLHGRPACGQDFIEAIREYLRKNPPPDLVVILPVFPGTMERDLEGRVFTEIERSINLPVALWTSSPFTTDFFLPASFFANRA